MILENLIKAICTQQKTVFVDATYKEADDVLNTSDLKTFHFVLDSIFNGRIEISSQGIFTETINFSMRILKGSELDNITPQRNTVWNEAHNLLYDFLTKLDYVFYDKINKVFVYSEIANPYIKVVQNYNNVEWTRVLNVFSDNTDGLLVRNINIILNTQFSECLAKTIYE
jgi:hypothetical protein